MLADRYYGYRNESEYHEHYTLAALLEREDDPTEQNHLQARIAEIEADRLPGCGCTGSH